MRSREDATRKLSHKLKKKVKVSFKKQDEVSIAKKSEVKVSVALTLPSKPASTVMNINMHFLCTVCIPMYRELSLCLSNPLSVVAVTGSTTGVGKHVEVVVEIGKEVQMVIDRDVERRTGEAGREVERGLGRELEMLVLSEGREGQTATETDDILTTKATVTT